MTIRDTTHRYTPVAVPVAGGGGGDDNDINSGGHLDEHFFATASAAADGPSPDAQPYLEVVAPATLPEGYTFDAEANGHSFTVRVPVGGVEEGQRFSVPFPAGANGYSGAAIPRASVPVGHWKDGVCDCFQHGLIHPVLWNACCCPLVLVGQVMHRLKLTWLASEGGTVAQTTATFRILLGITVAYQVTRRILPYFVPFRVDVYGEPIRTGWAIVLEYLLALSFFLFTSTMICRTRRRIRDRYGIPERPQCPGGCEDCLCSYLCCCCTVAQLARHTADYETYAGLCCSETGMPPHAPSIV